LFGNQTASAAPLFGGPKPEDTEKPEPAKTSLFGANTTTGSSLFGNKSNDSKPTTGSLFGGSTAKPEGGSLFGGAAPPSGGLFGNAPSSGGLFGN
jgi:nuclear pore complex protein Nup98-Nup96